MIIFKIVVSNTQTKTVQFKYSFELNGLRLWMESGELASGWIYLRTLYLEINAAKHGLKLLQKLASADGDSGRTLSWF